MIMSWTYKSLVRLRPERHSKFMCLKYVLNSLNDSLYNAYSTNKWGDWPKLGPKGEISKKQKFQCSNCDKVGHKSADCRLLNAENEQKG